MFPILISVSLAPVSYFFWASAALAVAAATVRPRNTVAKRRWTGVGIRETPCAFLGPARGRGVSCRLALIQRKIMFATKSPLRRCRRGHDRLDFQTGRSGSAAD